MIIISFNGLKWINRCIQSLKNSTILVDITFIDNASTDNTINFISENHPEVELILLNENIGFGQANNIGLRKAISQNYDYVFLLNQDVWIHTNCIKELLDVSYKYMNFGIISPMHWNGQENGLESKFNEYINAEFTPGLISDVITNQTLLPVYESQFINAAAWFMPINCIKQVGGFDPLFSHYGEDEDYVQRIHYNGFKIGVVPNAIIFHDSTFKSWDDIKFNRHRMMIIQYLQMKKVNTTLRSALLKYYKDGFNKLTDLFLYRKWNELFFLVPIIIRASFSVKKVIKSRKQSFIKKAFLE